MTVFATLFLAVSIAGATAGIVWLLHACAELRRDGLTRTGRRL